MCCHSRACPVGSGRPPLVKPVLQIYAVGAIVHFRGGIIVMRSGRFRGGWLFAALVILTASFIVAQQSNPTKKVDDTALKSAGKTGEEWLTYGLNYAETRYSPLKQIDSTNVKRLGLAWTLDIGNGGGGQEDTPLVSNGVIYAVTNWSIAFAVDARTGKEKWRWDPK